MTTRKKKAKGPNKRARRNDECFDETEEELVTELERDRNSNTPTIGIERSRISTHIVNRPTNPQSKPPAAAAPANVTANAELQATATSANIDNHSVIGAVSSFVSVGDRTGDTSSISEDLRENKKIIDHVPALFRLQKFITSVEELEWNGEIANFFYKRIGIEDRLQESWWAGSMQKVRKGIDSRRSTVSTAIKNEFIRKLYVFN